MKRKPAASPDRVQDPAQFRGDPAARAEPAPHRATRTATNDDESARSAATRRKRREPFVL